MTKANRAPREPKPPAFACVWSMNGSYDYLTLMNSDYAVSRRQMDALCRWWLKWRAWEKGRKP